ncbi:acyl-CoA thioesterase II [Microbacterium sediminicola]|uniref:Acyl-CoA thioesterase II n=1 Tax=Microbacterium sediminicola TaxID=415210 RepID=A0ABP4UE57_9MICO
MSTASGFLDAVALTADGDAFVAVTQPVPWPKSYGGDLLAQAAAAATATVGEDRTLHAAHSLFVAPAAIGATLRYEVDVLRDGRSYSSRRVTALEGEKIVLSGLFSFHVGEEGPAVGASPRPAPEPDSLPSVRERTDGAPTASIEYWADGRSFDLRHIDTALYTSPAGEPAGEVRLWMRANEPLGDDPGIHRLALVYVCDYAMLEPALRVHGWSWTDPGLVTASLDHSLWLHEDAALDEWILCELRLVSHTHGRALVQGEFFSASGTHIATVAQQGMIRRLPATAI